MQQIEISGERNQRGFVQNIFNLRGFKILTIAIGPGLRVSIVSTDVIANTAPEQGFRPPVGWFQETGM